MNDKKSKQSIEDIREKNNSNESKNLKTYKSLLDITEKLLQEAKSLQSVEGGSSGESSDSDSEVGSASGGTKKKAPDKWASLIKKASKEMGVKNLSDSDVKGIVSLIKNESGGDPKIQQQIQDVNSGGNEAQGLLQYTPGTFKNYAVKGHDDIHNGYDQLLAFFNNKTWKNDYNPNGGWSPRGAKVKAGGGGRDFNLNNNQVGITPKQLKSNAPTYTEPTYDRSLNYQHAMSTDTSTKEENNTTNNVNVSVNVVGANQPEQKSNNIATRLDSMFNKTDLSLFKNNHRRT